MFALDQIIYLIGTEALEHFQPFDFLLVRTGRTRRSIASKVGQCGRAGLPPPRHEGEFARHLVHHVGRDAAHLLEVLFDHIAFLRAQAAEQAGGRMLSHGFDENGRFGRPG